MAALRVSGATYTYDTPGEEVHALRGVDLKVDPGEMACLVGASGSGKSTLLTLLAGLDVPASGQVEVLGHDLAAMSEKERTAFRLQHIGVVFQDHNLVPQLTACENVELLLRARGVAGARPEALRALESVGVLEQAHRRPTDMSGGQRQRVGVARAIAGERAVVVCDEPTGSLDSRNSEQLFALLRDLARDRGVGVLVATHDHLALPYADSRLTLVDGVIVSREKDAAGDAA